MNNFPKQSNQLMSGLDKVGLFLIGRASLRIRQLIASGDQGKQEIEVLTSAVAVLPDLIRGDQLKLQKEIARATSVSAYLREQYQRGPVLTHAHSFQVAA